MSGPRMNNLTLSHHILISAKRMFPLVESPRSVGSNFSCSLMPSFLVVWTRRQDPAPQIFGPGNRTACMA